MDDLLQQVEARIAELGLNLRQAATAIGVSSGALERHLSGEYVRSDSLAKYRAWLNEGVANPRQPVLLQVDHKPSDQYRHTRSSVPSLDVGSLSRSVPHLVVDVFSGCGGLSLGFDSLHDETVFHTVLAVDVEEAMIRSYNGNHASPPGFSGNAGRQVDLADFFNETEILAFYLDHLSKRTVDHKLIHELSELPFMGLAEFKRTIAELDRTFLCQLQELRATPDFQSAYASLPSVSLKQTSVIGFHDALSLPQTSSREPALQPIVWWISSLDENPQPTGSAPISDSPHADELFASTWRFNTELWEAESEKLRLKATGVARGQLAASARRIRDFLAFLDSLAGIELQRLWLDWKSTRDALRLAMFNDDATRRALRAVYTGGRRVDVLLGGPPCQGFSRIGRGKIRSLRDHHVHVHADDAAGDARNRLLHAYVLFVSALEPRVFLFENVRHFQASVRTPDGTFLATEVLADAIRDISGRHLEYAVASEIIDASRHLIPQRRERFFMVGIRTDRDELELVFDAPHYCLALPENELIPLSAALDGLPEPATTDKSGNQERLARRVQVRPAEHDGGDAAGRYNQWIAHGAPGELRGRNRHEVDAHVARRPRGDDQKLFALLGPGTRWMDYRCDESATLERLRRVLTTVIESLNSGAAKADAGHQFGSRLAGVESEVVDLLAALDGSLSIRLLLESIPPLPGELQHHLLTPEYLRKREGNHGDWLARLDPTKPSKTIVSHMAKDTYSYIHPYSARSLSVREAARIQTFPDWFSFANLSLVDSFRVIGNAVPPLLSHQLAERVAQVLRLLEERSQSSSLIALAGT